MTRHSAKLETSSRLQRVHALLADGREYSTLDIVRRCNVCAVNSIIAELRDNGCEIRCRRAPGGTRTEQVYLYRMAKS